MVSYGHLTVRFITPRCSKIIIQGGRGSAGPGLVKKKWTTNRRDNSDNGSASFLIHLIFHVNLLDSYPICLIFRVELLNLYPTRLILCRLVIKKIKKIINYFKKIIINFESRKNKGSI